ncbi:MAG TPA: S-methyl-5-thioribose-1-phosphate isomerase [Spirochaetota bacterium]|nr:S-methyl-5-thioribose-1-phosphate isomerase [Spirochaetota bacterium]HQO01115.1 S-methyl-5-thioribose-1-phosphate isomerase [Spirochaetota bacterium]HQP48727.1 S-methyl-5-thioribose-1-phosphate isomerase [Spirochaetota bacterium]
MMYYTIKWEGDSVSMLDQRLLPAEETYHSYANYRHVAEAITDMVIRGAPAIGIAAAMGIALGAKSLDTDNMDSFRESMNAIFDLFSATRPTAVNLFWTINRMKKIVASGTDVTALKEQLEKDALAILEEDITVNKTMGKNGARFINDGDTVMTHCNAGALATGGYGTALGVIRAAIEEGKKIKVFACETRPYLQGARLTTWELLKDGIDVTLITDNMAGHFMKKGLIQKIVVGADRIAANGDTANKIGTYSHSVLAKEHNIPFYIAAPVSTLDPDTATGEDIVIEERSIDEVAYIQGVQIAPEGVSIKNPAFDVTPAANITAIITEKGVIENPKEKGIMELFR